MVHRCRDFISRLGNFAFVFWPEDPQIPLLPLLSLLPITPITPITPINPITPNESTAVTQQLLLQLPSPRSRRRVQMQLLRSSKRTSCPNLQLQLQPWTVLRVLGIVVVTGFPYT